MKQTLHIVNKSPFSYADLAHALHCMSEHDALLLCAEAVRGLTSAQWQPLLAQKTVFALAEDLQARAIQADKHSIDYAQMVTLTLEYQRVHSWQ